MITEILSKVNRPDFPLTWTATEHLPKIAWKTGTSYGRRDAWSIGYNKHFTVGVWVGNFSGVGVPELSGANTATPLLFKVFNTIDYNSNAAWYAPPKDLSVRQVCSVTGLPPAEHCTNLITDYFIPLISTNGSCQHMQEVKQSADGRISYCESCIPENGYIKKWMNVMAPELQQYYTERNTAFDNVPPHNPECEKIFRGNGPAVLSPRHGAEYFINTKEPEPLQLSAHTATDVTKVYWYIDDVLYKTAKPGEKQFFVPREGSIKVSCTDDKGRNTNVRIVVKHVSL
jgi:penicillin-binding protein 1C